MAQAPSNQPHWFALPLLVLGATGFAAGWLLLALALDRTCSWLALLAALDLVLLLRLGRWPAGAARLALAVLGTLGVIVMANGLIAAGQLGKSLGMRPWESALRIGPDYAWLLMRMANDHIDLALYAASLLLAAWLGGFSGRRPGPSAR
ncbi:MAG: hypothetical protein KGL91_11195 [Xanthomonadaceae bacterium]|nr:hypothetical protein [Xanthomonadaceae bacterium]